MRKIATVEKENRRTLYNNLKKLNKEQFKIFYGAFVHYWAEYKYFISKQNLFNLRCDLNLLCHELDESFPDQYDDYDAMKSFFLAHPYYYMDKLPIERMAKLFSEYVNDRNKTISFIINIFVIKLLQGNHRLPTGCHLRGCHTWTLLRADL